MKRHHFRPVVANESIPYGDALVAVTIIVVRAMIDSSLPKSSHKKAISFRRLNSQEYGSLG